MTPATTDVPVMLEEIKKLLDKGEQVITANRRLLQDLTQDGIAPRTVSRTAAPAIAVDVSVVVPVFNEIESIRPLRQELVKALDTLPVTFEIVFVDDGSTDGTYSVLQDLHAEFPYVRVIGLRQNFGKSAALQAGFEIAHGQIIITIDGDLQDDPAEIPRLIEAIEEGHDLVSGWKMTRRDPWSKRIPSRIFNWVVSRMTGLRLRDCNCGFKAYRRAVVDEIHLYGELHRFIPALAQARGFKVNEIPVNHRPRRFGKSKFGASRILRGFLDFLSTLAITKFNRRPFHLFGVMGFGFLSVGLVIQAYLSVLWLMGQWIGNRPLFMMGILFTIVGIQIILFGLLADLNLFTSRRREPPAIREKLE
jgi:glycosyltransferase involved in cell wall biosynthesis